MEIKDTISSGLLELYVLGMTNEQETAGVNALAKQYPEVAAEIAAIESSLQNYAALYAEKPGDAVKEKLLAEIGQPALEGSIQATGTSRTGKVVSISYWRSAAAAAAILLIGSTIFNVVFYNKYQAAQKDYEAAVTEKNNTLDQLASLEESNAAMKNDMGVIQSKYSEPVALHGLQAAPDAAAKIFWMKNTTGDVYIDPSNLPEAPTGMQYQLWGIVDGKPVDGGMIVTSKKGDKFHIQKMKTFGKAEAFAVTLETAGGNPTPKGDMYVVGKM